MFSEDVKPEKRAKQIIEAKSKLEAAGIKTSGMSASKILVKAHARGLIKLDEKFLETESRQMTLLEKLYGPGETRPFEGLRNDQAALRDSETAAARAHMARAGVKNTVFQDDAAVRKEYFGKSKAAWDEAEARNTVRKPRYYTMHQDFGNELIRHMNAKGIKFNLNTSVKKANVPGDQSQHPRMTFVAHATQNENDEMMQKFGRYLVYEGKSWDSFFSEALDSVSVAGVDGIPRTSPVQNQDDYVDNDDGAVYNGNLPNPADTLNKIFDAETQARLKARYGENWHELVAHELATIPRMQPNSSVNEDWKGLALAAATVAAGLGGGIGLGHHIGNHMANQPAYTPEPFVPTHRIIHNGEGVQVISTNDTHSTVRRWDGRSRRTTAIPNDELVPVHEELRTTGRDLANKMLAEDYVPLTESLAAALNYVNSVGHGDQKPKFKSAMAWLDAVGHLYGEDVAGRANDILYTAGGGHKAALDFVKSHASQGREALISRGTQSEHGNAARLDTGPYSQLHAAHLTEDFHAGILNPGGIFGRTPDEVYTKDYGHHDPAVNFAHPGQAPNVPPEILKYPSDTSTVTRHLNGMVERGEIRGFRWTPHTDSYGNKREKLEVTATHAQHQTGNIATQISKAKTAAYNAAYDRRGEWYSERNAKEEAPLTSADRPLGVTEKDKAVHRYLQDRNGASEEEVAKDVFSEYDGDTAKKLAGRYIRRVSHHIGAGKLK
jgi:hypothetical protein